MKSSLDQKNFLKLEIYCINNPQNTEVLSWCSAAAAYFVMALITFLSIFIKSEKIWEILDVWLRDF